ncbi:hypothetical protein HJG60_010529 [Phyllostomus discolor]|nr:hypothetical protein HJG60_010529 [Phyllostomus discolor]
MGFIFQKVGKLAAAALGGGYFLLQLANHTGYIKVNLQQVEKDRKKDKEPLNVHKSNHLPMEIKSKAEEMVSFVKSVLVTGFLGGFLLGILRRMTYCFPFFQLAASSFHLWRVDFPSSLLSFLLFSCAFLPALAYRNGFYRHLLVQSDNDPTVSLITTTEKIIDINSPPRTLPV